ncbi:hypothetical protein XELAEV_18046229mg [Xenopus laevis]|uniref:Uncharacterized protein n=1 Tax=Xenopus laevis TaxID=8355 RepID=A0A974H0Q4_XENLA|nr:hypothetical protein XELAEV_18046229mg [Xenopus laevis]
MQRNSDISARYGSIYINPRGDSSCQNSIQSVMQCNPLSGSRVRMSPMAINWGGGYLTGKNRDKYNMNT